MLVVGIISVVIASLFHCWYAANKAAHPGDRAVGFFRFGNTGLFISILILIGGLILVWLGSSIPGLIAALAAYFLILPLLIMPLMKRVYLPAPKPKINESEWEKIAGLNDVHVSIPSANSFWTQLFLLIQDATEEGAKFIDVNAGDLHRRVGGYPAHNHRMPQCCNVMKEEMQSGDLIMREPPKGAGASLTIRYFLPRSTSEQKHQENL